MRGVLSVASCVVLCTSCAGAVHAGAANLPQPDPAVAAAVERAIAANAGRMQAIETLRGAFSADLRLSEAERSTRLKRRTAREPAGGGEGQVSNIGDRSLCVGTFVQTTDRMRLDGRAIGRGVGNPWGFMPPLGGGPITPAPGGGQSGPLQLLSGDMPRTVIIYDGERSFTYFEALAQATARPQKARGRASELGPAARALFGASGSKTLASELAENWERRDSEPHVRFAWRLLSRERIYGQECEKLQWDWSRTPQPTAGRPYSPGGRVTLWLAPDLCLAPVRVERFTWLAAGGLPPYAAGSLWVAEDHEEAEQGLWLPGRVRDERARIAPGGAAEWTTIHVVQFAGIVANSATTPRDFEMTGPPIGTSFSQDVEYAAPAEVARQRDAWNLLTRWLGRPPGIQPDPDFLARLEAYARLPVPCGEPSGGG